MSALFWLVVRWVAVALIGVAVGSTALVLGLGSATLIIGSVALLTGGVFTFASIVATNMTALSAGGSSDGGDADLAGPGLRRATFLGLLGAGVIVGSQAGTEVVALVSGITGAVAAVLSVRADSANQRRQP